MGDFRSFAEAGRRLAELHVNYESVEPWPLKWSLKEIDRGPGKTLEHATSLLPLLSARTDVGVPTAWCSVRPRPDPGRRPLLLAPPT